MNQEEKANQRHASIDRDSVTYTVHSPDSARLILYLIIALMMSLGYILVLVDYADTLILPEWATFSFQVDEQIFGLIVPNILVILIAPVVWNKVSGFFLSFRRFSDHYLEAETNPTNLNDVWKIFKTKILSGISANIGLTFIAAFGLNYVLPPDLSGNDALFLSMMIMQLIPLIISGLVPFNWVLNDALIRYTAENGLIHDVGEDMNKGLLRKLIGIGGLILGLDVCYQLAFEAEAGFLTNWYVTGIYFVFHFILLSSGTIVIISLIYLTRFHEESVNALRSKLSKELPVARTVVNRNLPSRLQEVVSSFTVESSTKRNIVSTVLIIVSIIVLILCEYYILFVIGPFVLL
ncbi:MAG: hypothetical protein KGY80_07390 [Candidatus Thorarchaeota archaeon]|nr:hypothetical protein [Candidatus Thorarchaeota archaeon]